MFLRSGAACSVHQHHPPMLSCIIIDDEANARISLQKMIENFVQNVKVLGTAESVAAGAELIEAETPDVVFLDIEMPTGPGFELFGRYPNPDFEVVFTTAFDKYAVRAFKFAAFDYLLKPLSIEEVEASIRRIEAKRMANNKTVQLDVLFQHLKHINNQQNKILLPTANGYTVINMSEVIRLESSSNYTWFFLDGGDKLLVSRTLKEYDELLSEVGFFRVHQSHLVNLGKIKHYKRGNPRYLVMTDDSEVQISKRRNEDFLKAFEALFKS